DQHFPSRTRHGCPGPSSPVSGEGEPARPSGTTPHKTLGSPPRSPGAFSPARLNAVGAGTGRLGAVGRPSPLALRSARRPRRRDPHPPAPPPPRAPPCQHARARPAPRTLRRDSSIRSNNPRSDLIHENHKNITRTLDEHPLTLVLSPLICGSRSRHIHASFD